MATAERERERTETTLDLVKRIVVGRPKPSHPPATLAA